MKTQIVGDEVDIRGVCGVDDLFIRRSLALRNGNIDITSSGSLTAGSLVVSGESEMSGGLVVNGASGLNVSGDVSVGGLLSIDGTYQAIESGISGVHSEAKIAVGGSYGSYGGNLMNREDDFELRFLEPGRYLLRGVVNVRVSGNYSGKLGEIDISLGDANFVSATYDKMQVPFGHYGHSGNISSLQGNFMKAVDVSDVLNSRFEMSVIEYGSGTVLTPSLSVLQMEVWRLS